MFPASNARECAAKGRGFSPKIGRATARSSRGSVSSFAARRCFQASNARECAAKGRGFSPKLGRATARSSRGSVSSFAARRCFRASNARECAAKGRRFSPKIGRATARSTRGSVSSFAARGQLTRLRRSGAGWWALGSRLRARGLRRSRRSTPRPLRLSADTSPCRPIEPGTTRPVAGCRPWG